MTDLESLDEKIKKARDESTLIDKPAPKQSGGLNPYAAGVELVAGTAVGGFIGYYLDKVLATKPLFFIVCLLLGSAGGILNTVRQALRESKEESEKHNKVEK